MLRCIKEFDGMEGPSPQQQQQSKPTRGDFRFEVAPELSLPSYRLSNEREKTCYINSVVFALFGLTLRRPWLVLRERNLSLEGKPSLWEAFVKLFQRTHEEGGLQWCGEALESVLDSQQQQDAHEFLLTLVERLDAEVAKMSKGKKKKKKAPPGDAQGWTGVAKGGKSVVQTVVGGEESSEWGPMRELFCVLLKEVKKGGTLQVLEPSVGVSVARVDDISALRFQHCPRVLCVHLGRNANAASGRIRRQDLDVVQRLCLVEEETVSKKRCEIEYVLASVIFHAGKFVSSGHYVTRTRESPQTWIHHDDASAPTSFSSLFSGLSSNFEPYLLFFQRTSDLA